MSDGNWPIPIAKSAEVLPWPIQTTGLSTTVPNAIKTTSSSSRKTIKTISTSKRRNNTMTITKMRIISMKSSQNQGFSKNQMFNKINLHQDLHKPLHQVKFLNQSKHLQYQLKECKEPTTYLRNWERNCSKDGQCFSKPALNVTFHWWSQKRGRKYVSDATKTMQQFKPKNSNKRKIFNNWNLKYPKQNHNRSL